MQEKCICCGAPIPEGRQICLTCEHNGNPNNIPRQSNAATTPAEAFMEKIKKNAP